MTTKTEREWDRLEGYFEEQLRLASKALEQHRIERQRAASSMDRAPPSLVDRYVAGSTPAAMDGTGGSLVERYLKE
jgi:hypothetical protein